MRDKKIRDMKDLPRISGGGFGSCSVCQCAEFKGSGNICERCGHNYSEHW
jgi:hypothetical protein